MFDRALDSEGLIIVEAGMLSLANREEANRRGKLSVSFSPFLANHLRLSFLFATRTQKARKFLAISIMHID